MNAADAGAKLAAVVYAYLEDPEGVGTDALANAREEFMSHTDPERLAAINTGEQGCA